MFAVGATPYCAVSSTRSIALGFAPSRPSCTCTRRPPLNAFSHCATVQGLPPQAMTISGQGAVIPEAAKSSAVGRGPRRFAARRSSGDTVLISACQPGAGGQALAQGQDLGVVAGHLALQQPEARPANRILHTVLSRASPPDYGQQA